MRLNDRKILFYSFIVAVLVLLIIPVSRISFYDSSQPGNLPHYHSYISENLFNEKPINYDSLAGRSYLLNPYHLILALLGMLVSIKLASFLLAFILGILSVFIFYLILKEFRLKHMKKFIALLILIISPAFIYLFSVSNPYSLAVFFSLLAFLFFIKQKKIFFVLSLVLFSFTSLFGILHSLIVSLFLISYSVKKKTKLKQSIAISLVIILISLLYELPFLVKNNLLSNHLSLNPSYLIGLISDLGALKGFGIFTMLLMVFGMIVVWKTKKHPLAYIFLAVAFACSLVYTTNLNFYLVFPIAILSSYAFNYILRMRWTFSLIKQLAVIVVIAGILFSTISYLNQTALLNPDMDIIESMQWMKNSTEKGNVLTHHSRGLWIENIAQMPAFLDSKYRITPDYDKKLNISKKIFYSRTLENTTQWLNQNNIKYIWIDNEMKEHLVWTRKEEGLLFLFRNSETFKNVYKQENIEIWQVLT